MLSVGPNDVNKEASDSDVVRFGWLDNMYFTWTVESFGPGAQVDIRETLASKNTHPVMVHQIRPDWIQQPRALFVVGVSTVHALLSFSCLRP